MAVPGVGSDGNVIKNCLFFVIRLVQGRIDKAQCAFASSDAVFVDATEDAGDNRGRHGGAPAQSLITLDDNEAIVANGSNVGVSAACLVEVRRREPRVVLREVATTN